MARYFFDLIDGKTYTLDKIGGMYDTVKDAERDALAALTDIAKDSLSAGPEHKITIQLRDETGFVVATFSLVLDILRSPVP